MKKLIVLLLLCVGAFCLSYFGMAYATKWATSDLKVEDGNYATSTLKVAAKATNELQNASYNVQPAEPVQETAPVQVVAKVTQNPAPARYVQPKNESVEFTETVEPTKIAPLGCPYAEMMAVDDVKCQVNQ